MEQQHSELISPVPPASDPRTGETSDGYADRQPTLVPPVVYLPITGVGDGSIFEVEMRTTKDGRVALLAYTALDRFADCCGPHQPWALYATSRLPELEASQPYDVIYFDLPMPEAMRRQAQPGEGEAVR